MTGYLALVILALFLSGTGYFFYSRDDSDSKVVPGESYARTGDAPPDDALGKVLILTAAIGGGHEAAGRTVRVELEKAGRSVAMIDGLRTMSPALAWFLNRGYRSQVTNMPRSLGVIFAVTSQRAGAAVVRAAVSLLFARRLLKLVRREEPDLVISTYPLVTAALGYLRSRGRLRIPAAAVIADYGVHPLWVAPKADLHLVVSRRSAELTKRAGGEAAVVRMPVAPAFYSAPARGEAREALGIPAGAFVALVVGGAWGIGELGTAARCAADSGAYTIVVTGNNTELKDRLEESFGPRENILVLGWRKDMPVLMAAADCLIQNAGGMTCVEAIEVGLPIVIFEPIPGHGVLNTHIMQMAGAAHLVSTGEELQALVRSAARRETFLPVPKKEAGAQAVSAVLESLAGSAPRPAPSRQRPRLRPRLRPRSVLASVSLLAFLSWLAFAPMGVAVAAKEFRADVPGYNPSPGEVSLGVRVTDLATAAAVEGELRREKIPATVFANTRAAEGLSPAAGLAFGVAEEPGKEGSSLPWRARSQSRAAAGGIRSNTGTAPDYFLPATRTNLVAYADAPSRTQLVMPETTTQEDPQPGLLVVDTSGLGPDMARQRLAQTLREIEENNLRCVPLAEL